MYDDGAFVKGNSSVIIRRIPKSSASEGNVALETKPKFLAFNTKGTVVKTEPHTVEANPSKSPPAKLPIKPSVSHPHLFTPKPVSTPSAPTANQPTNQPAVDPEPDAEEQYQISQALNRVGSWA